MENENNKEILGYCKECGAAITKKDEMTPDYAGCYECPVCYYPSVQDDLWKEVPDYLKQGDDKNGAQAE